MFTDFVLKVKCTIFWLNRGLMVYLDLYAPDFPKSTSKYFLQPSTFNLKHPIFVAILVKNHQIMKKTLLATAKYENLVSNTFTKNLDD